MTPSKHGTTTSIRIEKVKKAQVDQSMVAHTAGGQHRGLVINKQSTAGGCCSVVIISAVAIVCLFLSTICSNS